MADLVYDNTNIGPGTGTAADPYIIKDLATLDAIRNDVYAHYMMINDVDIGGGLWEPFNFYGVLDGRGYFIKNLQIDKSAESAGHVGFISILWGGVVRNLNLETGAPTHIIGSQGNYVAVLCGALVAGACVENVCAFGKISRPTSGDGGGLIGWMNDDYGDTKNGYIRSCAAMVDVSTIGGSYSGAFIGRYVSYHTMEGIVYSSELAGDTNSLTGTNVKDLAIAQLAEPANYPDVFDFDSGSWEITEGGLPRVAARPVPVIEVTPDPGSGQARIAGTVTIDGTAVARDVVVISDDKANGRQVVGEGTSASDGLFDITYAGWSGPVIALALDNYGQAWAAATSLAAGTVVHPTVPNGYVYQVTTAGTTGTAEPTWSTEGSLTDGSVTYEAKPYYRPVASGPLEGEVTETVEAYRLWRVYMYETDNIYRLELIDIEFYDADHIQILTTGGTANAGASTSGYGAEYAFDGDAGTWWIGDYEAIPNWLSYHLPDPEMVAYVRIIPRTLNRAPTDFSLEYSEDDGQTWVEISRWTTTWPDDSPQEFTTL